MRVLLAAALLTAGCASSSAGNVRLTPEEERILRPLADPPDKIKSLVEDGDQQFLSGIAPYRASDPETGSDWAKNVASAFDCYTRARKAYLTAQGAYSGMSVPPPLLDRVNECVRRLAVLDRRRRAIPR